METNKQILARLKLDMQLRGMSEHTQRNYRQHVVKFLEFCGKPVPELDEDDVRRFLIHLLREGKLCNATINLHSAAIRFFFAVTLNRTMNYLQIPRFKKKKSLPVLLSRQEVQRLIMECANLKHRAYLLVAYGGGLRVSEIAALKVKDIDSKAMRIFVRAGKGGKDRYTILSNECLCALRDYWSVYRPKHKDGWLFLGQFEHTHITDSAVARAFTSWVKRLGIDKDVSIHSLRHAFATHLLEDGVSIFQIKELLGHASLSSTTIYLHLANTVAGVVSPADRFVLND
jgi:site-specific recombinase XerD